MRRILLVGSLLGATVAAAAAYAHHSFAATYFVDKEVTVEGTITQFLYRNPHSFVKVQLPMTKASR